MKKIRLILAQLYTPKSTALLLAITFFVIYSTHSLIKHWSYNSYAFDLGRYTQTVYQSTKTLAPYSTLVHLHTLSAHFEPILFVIAQIYRVFPKPETLLIIQALFVALSSIPLYFVAHKQTQSTLASTLLILTYLTSTGIYTAINYDFHTTTLSTLPLSIMIFTWYFKKWPLYWLSLFFCLLFKEDLPIFILGMGLVQLTQKQIKVGFSSCAFALISFYVIQFLITPQLTHQITAHTNLHRMSASSLQLNNPITALESIMKEPLLPINILLNHPIKQSTLLIVYGDYLFIPAFSTISYFTVLPYLFLRFSANAEYANLWSSYVHYNSNLQPFLVLSTAYILRLILNKVTISYRNIKIICATIIFFATFKVYFFYTLPFNFYLNKINELSYVQQSFSEIPSDASLSTHISVFPHLANRDKIYLYPEVYEAEFILLDHNISDARLTKKELLDSIETLKQSPEWKVHHHNNSLYIFQKVAVFEGRNQSL